MDNHRLLRFGDFTLDPAQGLLFQSGRRLRLTPKLIALLTVLVERRGSVVPHEDIVRVLWPDTVVESGGLSRNVSMLRKQLDANSSGRYIENIPKRGYRFVAEVTEIARCGQDAHDPLPAAIEPRTSPGRSIPTRSWLAALACITLVSAALLAGVSIRQEQRSWRATPITTNSAALPIISADMSSDGRRLAYVETSGAADTTAYIRTLDSSRVQRLPSLHGIAPGAVSWYADSAHLLLSGFDPASRRYVAWTTSAGGGPPKIILENAHRATLSPDGHRIAFYRNRRELWLAAPDGTSEHLFATAPPNDRFRLQPQFSADGKFLIVGRVTRLPYSPVIEAHRLSDGQVRTLFDPGGRAVFDMLLRPDDELIVSLLVGYDHSELLGMQVNFPADTVGIPATLTEFDDLAYGLHGGAHGNSITVVRDRSQADVYTGSLGASGTTLSGIQRLTLDDSWDQPYSWLDDRTILFSSNRSGRRGIYLQAIDAARAEPLVVDEQENFGAAVTPDRRWLWYYSKRAGQSGANVSVKLMRRPLSGGPAQAFDTSSNAWRSLRCSQYGACVRLELERDETVFYSFDPFDGSGHELARAPSIGPFIAFSWDLSPDGNRIVYVDRAANALGLIDLTRPQQRTGVRIDWHQSPQGVAWSHDGDRLFVTCFEENDSSTLLVTLEGEVTLLRYQPVNRSAWAKPSPDGRHLLLADATRASNVWTIAPEDH